MKVAIKCVKKGKCFPNRLGKMLLSTSAGKLMEGLSWLQKHAQTVLTLPGEERKKGCGQRRGQDLSFEFPS